MNKYILLAISLIFIAGCGASAPSQNSVNSYSADETSQNDNYSQQEEQVNNTTPDNSTNSGSNMEAPKMEIDQNKTYTAVLHTSEGDIEVSLNAKATPVTVNNFVTLSKKDFYDNTIFHRVIKDFMIQGGDPKGDGTGGPGYKFNDEPFQGEYSRGTIAMANAGPNTNGSQFFIMHANVPLPKNYVIFGKVTKGMEVVDKIATAPVKMSWSGEESAPVNPVKVTDVEILEK